MVSAPRHPLPSPLPGVRLLQPKITQQRDSTATASPQPGAPTVPAVPSVPAARSPAREPRAAAEGTLGIPRHWHCRRVLTEMRKKTIQLREKPLA